MGSPVAGVETLSWEEVLRGSGYAVLPDVPLPLRRAIEMVARQMWQPLRAAWGRPLIVASGLRSPEANRSAGGARTSTHMRGLALDIRTPHRADLPALYDLVRDLRDGRRIPRGGLALYRGGSPDTPGQYRFCHVDMRGWPAGWGRSEDGRRVNYRRDRLDA